MNLLLVRHAIAEKHDASNWPDDFLRPLSKQGIKRFRSSAKRLGRIVEPDVLLTSPFVRAIQTSELLHDIAGWPNPESRDEIPRGEFAILAEKQIELGTKTLAIVGHEPSISTYVSRLISGVHEADVQIKPGTAVLLKLDSHDSGELRWLAPTVLFQ